MAIFSEVANCVYSAITTDLTAVTTTIVVADATGFPATEPYYLTVWDAVAHPDPADDTGREIVQVTGRAGATLTVVRGQDDTGAATHNTGDRIALLLVKVLIDEWTTAINAHTHVVGDGGVLDHGGLSGLADDDHAQYLLIDGSRDMTGPLTIATADPAALIIGNGAAGIDYQLQFDGETNDGIITRRANRPPA